MNIKPNRFFRPALSEILRAVVVWAVHPLPMADGMIKCTEALKFGRVPGWPIPLAPLAEQTRIMSKIERRLFLKLPQWLKLVKVNAPALSGVTPKSLPHQTRNNNKSDRLAGTEHLERWVNLIETNGSALTAEFDRRNILNDLGTSIRVTGRRERKNF